VVRKIPAAVVVKFIDGLREPPADHMDVWA
jgi:hypothetical protein